MTRILLSLISLCMAMVCHAAEVKVEAAVYDANGNFIDVATVTVNPTDTQFTLTIPAVSDVKGVYRYALPSQNKGNYRLLKAETGNMPYLLVDDTNYTLRLCDDAPAALNDFDYALSFDPGDWARFRSQIK